MFFFNDTATTEIYTLSLHDALPISQLVMDRHEVLARHLHAHLHPEVVFPIDVPGARVTHDVDGKDDLRVKMCMQRSEEHTSELQSRPHLVCRLLLEH